MFFSDYKSLKNGHEISVKKQASWSGFVQVIWAVISIIILFVIEFAHWYKVIPIIYGLYIFLFLIIGTVKGIKNKEALQKGEAIVTQPWICMSGTVFGFLYFSICLSALLILLD